MIDYTKIRFDEIDKEEPTQVFYYYDLTEQELDNFIAYYIPEDYLPSDVTVTDIELCLTIFVKRDYKLEAICNTGDNKIWVELWYQVANADEFLKLIPKEEGVKI